MEALPQPGEILAGKYEIVRPLGRGGMGVVYEAIHLRLGQSVALKLLKPDLATDAAHLERFAREARAAARLTTSHVARIFDVETTPAGTPFIVMELLVGRDLSFELAERTRLPLSEAVDIALQICSAIAEAHAFGVVHRDLKPANVFLVGEGPRRMVKVLDFGISKLLSGDEALDGMTTPSLALGTPHYMSPEQISASKNVDARTDIWALGVLLYKMLSGRLPFHEESATATVVAIATGRPTPILEVVAVPAKIEETLARALAKAREERFQRVEELARAIESFGTGATTFVPPTPSSRRPGMVPADTSSASLDIVSTTPLSSVPPWLLPTEKVNVPLAAAELPASTRSVWATPPVAVSPSASSRRPPRRVLLVVGGAVVAVGIVVGVGFSGPRAETAAAARTAPASALPPPPAPAAVPAAASETATTVEAAPAPSAPPSHRAAAPRATTKPRVRPSPGPTPVPAPASAPAPSPAAKDPVHL